MSDNYEIKDKNNVVLYDTSSELITSKPVYLTRNCLDDKVDKKEFNKEVRKLRQEMKRMAERKYTFIRGGIR